jgi:hypothetical protein
MALLNAAELLRDDETESNIQINGIKLDEESEPGSIIITLKRSRKIVNRYKEIYAKHTKVRRTLKTKGKHRGEIDIKSEGEDIPFIKDILDLAYVKASGDLIDEYSIELIMAAVELFPYLSETLASAMVDFYQKGGKFIEQEDEDDKKK